MRKMLFLLSALVLMGSYGYAQTEGEENTSGTESSAHGTMISELSKTTTVTGKEKGALISSAARAKALTVANANARFIRGSEKPANANVNENANANGAASVNASANVNANGKPVTLPPVTPPTIGKPATTPVGRPVGVPVAPQGAGHGNGN